MAQKNVNVDPVQLLYLDWRDDLNASGIFRQKVNEVIEEDDAISKVEVEEGIKHLRGQGYSINEIKEEADSITDFKELIQNDA